MIAPHLAARLHLAIAASLALTACGTLLDSPADNLQLAQNGITPPGSNFCTAGSSGAGGSAAGAGGASGKGGEAGFGGTAGKGGSSGQAGSSGKGGSGGIGGEAGASGSSGYSGAAGSSAGTGGAAGTGGKGGSSGAAGQGGTAGGSAGAAGEAGNAGAAGEAGAAGQAGSSGQAGAAGQAGQAGVGGASGSSGQAGAAGESGAGGSAGSAGSVTGSPYDAITSVTFTSFESTPLVGITSEIAALKTGEEVFQVFALDGQQQVQFARYALGSWVSTPLWTAVPTGAVEQGPAVVSDAYGVIHVLVLQGSQVKNFYKLPATWKESLVNAANGGSIPAAVSNKDGGIEVFVRSPQGTLLQATVTKNDGAAWQDLGGAISSAPAVVSDKDSIHVFARGADNSLVHLQQTGGKWGSWESWGGALSSAPAVASWGPLRLDVFARGTSGTLQYIAQREDGTRADAWTDLGVQIEGAPAAVAWGIGQLRVLARDSQGTIGMAGLVP